MKTFIFIAVIATVVCAEEAAETKTQEKRGLVGLGYGGYHGNLGAYNGLGYGGYGHVAAPVVVNHHAGVLPYAHAPVVSYTGGYQGGYQGGYYGAAAPYRFGYQGLGYNYNNGLGLGHGLNYNYLNAGHYW